MLVFTRKPEEAIIIGDGIEVRVLRVGRTHVRLGVVAARNVPVHRREIYDQVRAVNAAAASDSQTATEVAARLRTRKPQPVTS